MAATVGAPVNNPLPQQSADDGSQSSGNGCDDIHMPDASGTSPTIGVGCIIQQKFVGGE